MLTPVAVQPAGTVVDTSLLLGSGAAVIEDPRCMPDPGPIAVGTTTAAVTEAHRRLTPIPGNA
jgi:hypothetical protein